MWSSSVTGKLSNVTIGRLFTYKQGIPPACSPLNVAACSYAGSKEGFCFPQMAKALAARQLSSLRFDFSGNGDSEGAFEFGNYWQEVRN